MSDGTIGRSVIVPCPTNWCPCRNENLRQCVFNGGRVRAVPGIAGKCLWGVLRINESRTTDHVSSSLVINYWSVLYFIFSIEIFVKFISLAVFSSFDYSFFSRAALISLLRVFSLSPSIFFFFFFVFVYYEWLNILNSAHVYDVMRATLPTLELDAAFEAKEELASSVKDALTESFTSYVLRLFPFFCFFFSLVLL